MNQEKTLALRCGLVCSTGLASNARTFRILLTRYALERLLYRLSLSAHRDRFILKGELFRGSGYRRPAPASATFAAEIRMVAILY